METDQCGMPKVLIFQLVKVKTYISDLSRQFSFTTFDYAVYMKLVDVYKDPNIVLAKMSRAKS